MACTDAYATINEFANFWGIDCTQVEAQNSIESVLDTSATNIHIALASVDACDCTLASWAEGWLQKLNIIEAGVLYNSRCGAPSLTDEAKRMYLEWMDRQLELVRTGKLDVCDGATGADFPSVTWAEQGVTEFAAARIIYNDQQRNAG
jgi:hypothetical protein